MNVNGIGQNYYQNNVSANRYNRSRAGQFYPQKQAAEESAPGSARQNANVQDIYDALKSTNPIMGQEENTVSNDSGLTVWYGDKTLEEWRQQIRNIRTKQQVFHGMSGMGSTLI